MCELDQTESVSVSFWQGAHAMNSGFAAIHGVGMIVSINSFLLFSHQQLFLLLPYKYD